MAASKWQPIDLLEEQRRLRDALEARSRQFHRAERDRTATFAGAHGTWMGKCYDKWEDCPSNPCANDRELLAALTGGSR